MGRDVKRISRRPVDPVATEGQAPGEKGQGLKTNARNRPRTRGKGTGERPRTGGITPSDRPPPISVAGSQRRHATGWK